MKTFRVLVTQEVVVTLDEAKFTPAFCAEFRASFFDFHDLEEHAEHLGFLAAKGFTGDTPDAFVEGYGHLDDMGITLTDGEVFEIEVSLVPEGAA